MVKLLPLSPSRRSLCSLQYVQIQGVPEVEEDVIGEHDVTYIYFSKYWNIFVFFVQ